MLTRKAKYALKALITLAQTPGEPLRASSISKRNDIPKKFLEIILFDLTRAGVLESRKGPGGGYLLARDPAQIPVGTVLRVTDGPLAPVPCVSETDYQRCEDCPDENACHIRGLMQRVRDVTAATLDGASLADLAGQASPVIAEDLAPAAAAEAMGKTPLMVVHKTAPFNAGPPTDLLRERIVTPQPIFFVRNHGAVPRIEAAGYRLEVTGLVNQELRLSLPELRERFEEVTLEASLMCAGNRRQEFDDIRPIRGEVPWGAEAVSNATWTGVRLRDVLEAAGAARGARHAEFEGFDDITREGRVFGFGGSIPLAKARQPEVLLAYEMNGQPLPPTHGFPLRMVVPGFIGARSVKWLKRIHLQKEASSNYFQANAYKLFPPHIRPETADWNAGQMLGELFTTVAICSPSRRAMELPAGDLDLRGYALAGDGRSIQRVEVSSDDGESWREARIERGGSNWAWCFWECRVNASSNLNRIWVRAWDDQEVQPPFAADLWNFKGYMNNSWYCLRNTSA